jgi:hypothetical protein
MTKLRSSRRAWRQLEQQRVDQILFNEPSNDLSAAKISNLTQQ